MKRYQQELHRLSFDEGAKRRIVQHLCEAQPRRKGFPPLRRVIAAGVAAALCVTTGAACATSLASHSPAFREFFNITDGRQESLIGALALDLTFEDQNGSGASITVTDVTMDSDFLYAIMELNVPEGISLTNSQNKPVYDCFLSDGTGYPVQGCGSIFYHDKDLQHPVWVSGTEKFRSLLNGSPIGNKITMVFQYDTEGKGFPADAHYIRLENYGALYTYSSADRERQAILENLDFDIVFPLSNTTPTYAFEGRLYTLLGGVAPVVLENLSISPYSLTFDVFIPDPDAYWQARDEYGPWEIKVTMNDGTIVRGHLAESKTAAYWSKKAQAYYGGVTRAHILLNTAIDPAEIDEIDFGDTSEVQDEPAFSLFYFENPTYWTDVKKYR